MKRLLRTARTIQGRLSKRMSIVALLIFSAVVVVSVGLYLKQHRAELSASRTSVLSSPKTLQKATDLTAKKVDDTNNDNAEVSTQKEAVIAPQATSQQSSSTTPSQYKPTTTTKPTPTPPQPVSSPAFSVNYLYVDQPAVYCAGGGDYYIAQMGNVMMGLSGGSGGQVTFGFEVTGGIVDNWHGYHQPATVPAGTYSTSFNVLTGRGEPNMAYSEVIWSGHGPATIRAVVYSPNLVYSAPLNVPAQNVGEKCN
jgi:hypothetical protein